MNKKVANKQQVAERIEYVSKALIEGYTVLDLCQSMSKKWGVSERQVRRYIEKAYERLYDASLQKLEHKKAFHHQARLRLYKSLLSRMQDLLSNQTMEEKTRTYLISLLSPKITDVLKDMAKIDGLYVDRHEHTGKDGKDLFGSRTSDEIQQEIDKLKKIKGDK